MTGPKAEQLRTEINAQITRAVEEAVSRERTRCAEIADVWSETTAGRAIAEGIREGRSFFDPLEAAFRTALMTHNFATQPVLHFEFPELRVLLTAPNREPRWSADYFVPGAAEPFGTCSGMRDHQMMVRELLTNVREVRYELTKGEI